MVRRRLFSSLLCLSLITIASSLRSVAQQPAPASLDALSGEFTDLTDPATPMTLYAKDGKLIVESERLVPTELKPVSATEFAFPEGKSTIRISLDAAGHAASIVFSDEPDSVYKAPATLSITSSTITSAPK